MEEELQRVLTVLADKCVENFRQIFPHLDPYKTLSQRLDLPYTTLYQKVKGKSPWKLDEFLKFVQQTKYYQVLNELRDWLFRGA